MWGIGGGALFFLHRLALLIPQPTKAFCAVSAQMQISVCFVRTLIMFWCSSSLDVQLYTPKLCLPIVPFVPGSERHAVFQLQVSNVGKISQHDGIALA
jgi:hypothetical protein